MNADSRGRKMFKRKHKSIGQTTIEYVVLLTILMGALLAGQNYVKRGIQGRWRAAVDEVGDQYDPEYTNASIYHTLLSNSITTVSVINTINGLWTFRTDVSNAIERKTGFMAVGAY